WEKAEGAGHPAVAQTSHNLATLYIASGRYQEAEPLLFAARKILEQSGDRQHLAVIFETLAMLYHRSGRPGEGNEFAARAHRLKEGQEKTR
ncbi:MAG: tetratricopeptide repeat protein, partial [Desulforhopalus sp.]|nr:tetratricopeptide repeat protein [Desulforhopalus sp.]